MDLKNEAIRQTVRENYAQIALGASACGCACGCGPEGSDTTAVARSLGYSVEDLARLPEGANLGLGCGTPLALAQLSPGETVLDLGSGAGIDCLLAATKVGDQGRVIGVDMTPDMLSRARKNGADRPNVEFRLGEIEHLPVADGTVDVIISNCVINLSPEKPQVFREAFRVLKSGGRLAVSDTLASAPIPDEVKADLALHAGCVSGASTQQELEGMLQAAGFRDIRITPKEESKSFIKDWAPGRGVESWVVSADVQAWKP